MTNEETIDWCRNFQDNLVACKQECDPRYAYALKAMSTAIDALEKQMPQRAVNIRKGEVFRIGYCPRCGEGLSEEFKYCLECGQAIDWSEE